MGHHLDLKITGNEIKWHVIKKSHLPTVQETDHEPNSAVLVVEPAVGEVVDESSQSCFSIHDNQYDNSDPTIPNLMIGYPKRTGEEDLPVLNDTYKNWDAAVLVPHLPVISTPPHALTSIPANDVNAAVIARVTQKAIEDLSREGKTLAEIEEATRSAAVAHIMILSCLSSEC